MGLTEIMAATAAVVEVLVCAVDIVTTEGAGTTAGGVGAGIAGTSAWEWFVMLLERVSDNAVVFVGVDVVDGEMVVFSVVLHVRLDVVDV